MYRLNKLWVFDKDVLESIMQDTQELGGIARINAIVSKLNQCYPGMVNKEINWLWSNAAGGMWYVGLLHISMVEYLMITGNGCGTEGHSGRTPVVYTDYVIDGDITYSYEHTPYEQVTCTKDQTINTPFMSARSYNIKNSVCLMEYCRGPIITVFPLGIMDTLFSTLDLWSLAKAFYYSGLFIITHPLLTLFGIKSYRHTSSIHDFEVL